MDTSLIQLTNFKPHPEDKKYMVFMFYEDAIADYFEELLIQKKIDFVKDKDDDNSRPRYLFAIKRTFLETAIHLNYTAHGKHRKPSLNHQGLRWILIVFVGLLLMISLYAYFTYGVKH